MLSAQMEIPQYSIKVNFGILSTVNNVGSYFKNRRGSRSEIWLLFLIGRISSRSTPKRRERRANSVNWSCQNWPMASRQDWADGSVGHLDFELKYFQLQSLIIRFTISLIFHSWRSVISVETNEGWFSAVYTERHTYIHIYIYFRWNNNWEDSACHVLPSSCFSYMSRMIGSSLT